MAITNGKVSVGTTPTLICTTTALAPVELVVHGPGVVFLGGATVTADTGLPCGNSADPFTIQVNGALYGVASATDGPQSITYFFSS